MNSTAIFNDVPKISGQRSWDHMLGNVAIQRLSMSPSKFKEQIKVSNFITITLLLYIIIHVFTIFTISGARLILEFCLCFKTLVSA